MKKMITDAFGDKSIKVPFIIPEITKNDKHAVSNALNSSLLTDGPKLHRMKENIDIYDFEIDTKDMTLINSLARNQRLVHNLESNELNYPWD